MWIFADYEATALFSLKPATSTSSGGKTLLIPTPFAIKMAVLDVICRTEGVARAESLWSALAGAVVAIRPPARVVVNNTFTKIWKPRRKPAMPGSRDAGPLGASIAYREYAYLDGTFGIGLDLPLNDVIPARQAANWLAGIQYLGKRGSFVQIQALPEMAESLPGGFLTLDGRIPDPMPLQGVMHQVDDTSPAIMFGRVNIYSDEKLEVGKHRLLRPVVLPYQVRRASRSFTYYEYSAHDARIGGDV
jgi:hypothetical protein